MREEEWQYPPSDLYFSVQLYGFSGILIYGILESDYLCLTLSAIH